MTRVGKADQRANDNPVSLTTPCSVTTLSTFARATEMAVSYAKEGTVRLGLPPFAVDATARMARPPTYVRAPR